MFTSKALLACYTILELVQLGEAGRQVSVFLKPLPNEKELPNFEGEVSFSLTSSVLTSVWNGELIIFLATENQQPISTGTINQTKVVPTVTVAPANGTEKKTGFGAVAEFFGKLMPSKEPTEKKLEKKDMEKRKKHYQSWKGKYTIYINALPGVMSGVTTLYPLLNINEWTIDDACKMITIPFTDFTISQWDNIDLASESHSQLGILENTSNRLYIYRQLGDPLPFIVAALKRACTLASLTDKSFPQSFPPLFVKQSQNGKDTFYDVGCNNPENVNKPDEATVKTEGDVFVVDVTIIKSYYNTELKFYDLSIGEQIFVASRNEEQTSPFLLKTNLDSTYAPLGEITKSEFYGPKVCYLTGPWKDRWGSRQPQKWDCYNFSTELCVVDGIQIGYNLREIMEPRVPITVTKPGEKKPTKRLKAEPWVPATVTFTETKFTFCTTTGSKTTITYSSQNTGWIKKKERFIWINFTRGVDGLGNDYIARRSARDKEEVKEIKGNVTVRFYNKIYTVIGIQPEAISVVPENNDGSAFMFSFTEIKES